MYGKGKKRKKMERKGLEFDIIFTFTFFPHENSIP